MSMCILAPTDRRGYIRRIHLTDADYSEGYLQLRKAPQQDAHPLPTLLLVPTPRVVLLSDGVSQFDEEPGSE
jgi:hypothetical protein